MFVERKAISYNGCMAQVFILCFFGITECFLLATMAYDRYVAICRPLVYSIILSPRLCVQLVVGSYFAGWINAMSQTVDLLQLSFCGSHVIDLFFCDISPLLSLSTSDASISQMVLLTTAAILGAFTILIVLISYTFIVATILKNHSTEGKHKAFSTCASHLTVVSIFYGTSLFMYLKSSSDDSRHEDKWTTVFYTVVTPMLNPLIYSLRNKDVKDATRKVMAWKKISNILNK
ncbi:olfactory receptor 5P60-like [Alligator mississippiensis]|uniref:olfactory receptor 5P60-like n=1 Tax=Alligator mississippiensis TaxID=8496 RepID=UPI0007115847|nr:olfactory receptor 5P60-like [Alligator mississippiensis]